jgi:hypothetical protein
LTTADNIPLAVELPVEVLGDVVEQLGQIAERLQRKASGGSVSIRKPSEI